MTVTDPVSLRALDTGDRFLLRVATRLNLDRCGERLGLAQPS